MILSGMGTASLRPSPPSASDSHRFALWHPYYGKDSRAGLVFHEFTWPCQSYRLLPITGPQDLPTASSTLNYAHHRVKITSRKEHNTFAVVLLERCLVAAGESVSMRAPRLVLSFCTSTSTSQRGFCSGCKGEHVWRRLWFAPFPSPYTCER